MATGVEADPMEIGIFAPTMKATGQLEAGEVGYIATGLKTIRDCHVGDTITSVVNPTSTPLPGYRPAKPMVFAGIYPVETDDYPLLKDALEKLQLNDASLIYEPETSQALNFGFRCGFLGLFHMEIIQERIEREYDLDIIATAPSVEYEILMATGDTITIDSPAQLPDPSGIEEIREPWMKVQIFTPAEYIGTVMDLVIKRRGSQMGMEYLDPLRVMITYALPLSELIIDFHDQLKSRTRGYASMDYSFLDYRAEDLVKMDILVNEMVVDALAMIVHRDMAYHQRQRDRLQDERADPVAVVCHPDSGGGGRQDHFARQRPGAAQRCVVQVLRRRHHPQAQAAGEAEGRQEAHEDGGLGGSAAGSVYGDFEGGRRLSN